MEACKNYYCQILGNLHIDLNRGFPTPIQSLYAHEAPTLILIVRLRLHHGCYIDEPGSDNNCAGMMDDTWTVKRKGI